MFKKAGLYLLLSIIVASTVVGLFGFSQTVLAQSASDPDEGCDNTTSTVWAGEYLGGDSTDAICHIGDFYVWVPSTASLVQQDPSFKDTPCGSAPIVYVHNMNGSAAPVPEPGLHVLCFTKPGNEATFIHFPNGALNGSTYSFGSPGNVRTATIEGEPIDGEFFEEEEDILDDETDEPTDGETETPSSCQIKGVGWLICPVVNFMAEITDESYDLLNKTLLKLEPMALPGGGGNQDGIELYNSWKTMRDIANIAFIVGFLIIVFSQITSIGVSNYGIKRLLPKIIIAAILVNLSYFICVIAVDLSNILGNSMRELFQAGTPNQAGATPLNIMFKPDANADGVLISSWQELAYVVVGGAGVAASAVITGALMYAFLPLFLPMIIGAVLAVVTVVIALTLRQALVVVLVVISPLAFVALLLPNTEGYFKKWRSLFTAMLLVYPIISIVFGASALASRILMNTGDFPIQIVGAGVSLIPLFITPIIMKASGGLLNRWVGIVNNPNKGPIDAFRRGAQSRADRWENKRKITSMGEEGRGRFGSNTRLGRVFGSRYRNSARNEAIDAGVKAETNRATKQYVAREVQNDPYFQAGVAGSNDPAAMERALAGARFTVEQAELEEVKAAGVTVENMQFSQLARIADQNNTETSNAQKAAALQRMVAISDPIDYEGFVNEYGSRTDENEAIIRRTLSESLSKNNSLLRASDLDNIANGQLGRQRFNSRGGTTELDEDGNDTGRPLGIHASSLEEMTRTNTQAGVLSAAKMAAASSGDIAYAFRIAQRSAATDPRPLTRLIDTAQGLLANPQLSGNIKHNISIIQTVAATNRPAAGTPPPAPAPPPPPGAAARPDDV